jgi:hypothetical protein
MPKCGRSARCWFTNQKKRKLVDDEEVIELASTTEYAAGIVVSVCFFGFGLADV